MLCRVSSDMRYYHDYTTAQFTLLTTNQTDQCPIQSGFDAQFLTPHKAVFTSHTDVLIHSYTQFIL